MVDNGEAHLDIVQIVPSFEGWYVLGATCCGDDPEDISVTLHPPNPVACWARVRNSSEEGDHWHDVQPMVAPARFVGRSLSLASELYTVYRVLCPVDTADDYRESLSQDAKKQEVRRLSLLKSR